jgi:hypothetical protein
MGFKSRQKKRATSAGRRAARTSEHYLALVRHKCACTACGGILNVGSECVYRHTPREILCPACAESRGLKPRPSHRWELARQMRIDGGST